MSNDLKDLLKRMLVADSGTRISYKELFQHQWLNSSTNENFEQESQNLLKSILATVVC